MMKRLLSVATLALSLAACGGGEDGKPAAPAPVPHTAKYEIEGFGTTSASLTYRNSTGGTEQRTVTLPASVPGLVGVYFVETGDFLYISAQNNSSFGSVQVRIVVDGTTWRSATSSGAFGVATASGSCC